MGADGGRRGRPAPRRLPPMSERQHQWEARYSAVDRLWSGRPNDWLPELAADWTPGRALDVGCGEGADVLWLAEHGWDVTGLDLSATAVARMGEEARRRGLADRVHGRVHDVVRQDPPAGPFDLVTVFYVHGSDAPGSVDLPALLARCAAFVARGGHLVCAVHCVNPPWHRHHALTYTPEELLAGLAGATDGWRTEVAERRRRDATGPDGAVGQRVDAVVCLRRPAGPAPDDGES